VRSALSAPSGDDRELFSRTIRTVAALVGACVLFVGLLSITAVVVTSRAVSGSSLSAASESSPANAAGPAKKPLSI
jgi:hypothetical protein